MKSLTIRAIKVLYARHLKQGYLSTNNYWLLIRLERRHRRLYGNQYTA